MRRIVRGFLVLLTLIIGASAAIVVVTQTNWFKDWLRRYVIREANQFLNGRLSVERLGGNLFFGLKMQGVAISMEGGEIVTVKDLELDYSVFELLSTGLFVDGVRLEEPTLYLRREAEGWEISKLIKKPQREADRRGPAFPIAIDAIDIRRATIVIDPAAGVSGIEVPERIDRLDARLSFKYQPVHYSLEIERASLRTKDPAIRLLNLSGGVAVRDDALFLERIAVRTERSAVLAEGAIQQYLTKPTFNLRISSDQLSLPEIAGLVPAIADVALQPAFELTAAGPAEALAVEASVRSAAGDASGSVVADVAAPGLSIAGGVSVRHLNLASIVHQTQWQTDLTADANLDLHADAFSDPRTLQGTVSVNAPNLVAAGYAAQNLMMHARVEGGRIEGRGRAIAYGAEVTMAGLLVMPKGHEPLTYDVRGHARQIDLRRLPGQFRVPPAQTDVSAEFHARGSEPLLRSGGRTIDVSLRFEDSEVAGAQIGGGSTARLSLRRADLEFEADATVSGLDLRRAGQEFGIPALEVDGYTSDISGHVSLNGQASSVRDVVLTASGTVRDSSILGGRIPRMAFDLAARDGTARVKAAGTFEDFDPAMLTGKPATKGSVTGSLEIDGVVDNTTAGLTPANVNGTARVVLEPSALGGLAINEAILDGDFRDSSLLVRQFELVGLDLNAHAAGRLTLGDTGESNLSFQAESPRLQELGRLVDIPVSGLAQVQGTVSGNGTMLRAAGTLTGGNLKYGDADALSLAASYTARVPDFDVADAEVAVEADGTFVRLAGQEINELTLKATYVNQQVEFDATARQPRRTLAAGGAMILHSDHREVHLRRLELDADGVSWQIAPGSQAALQHRGDAFLVQGLRLVNGDQHIWVDGMFGRSGDALGITLSNVDLAAVDALLLRTPQFFGRINAEGTLGGTFQAPQGSAEFRVTHGRFRTFEYETFVGTVEYERAGLTLDAKLQQNPSQWITAKGYVPRALFSSPTVSAPDDLAHHVDPAPDSRVDLAIDSSPIDLGLIQGFTDLVTEVAGTVEAHVRVTGSAADPHPVGEVDVRDGAMRVVPSGVSYRKIAGRIELQPDRVHIDQITVLDNHDSALTVTGDLALHERQFGRMHLYVTADDFKILDNALGNVRVDSQMEVAGGLRSPRLEGYLGVSTGQIEVDEVIARTEPALYATEPVSLGSARPGEGDAASATGLVDALQVDLQLLVPNALVVKAGTLQLPDAPIGLGSLTVTLGGDLRVRKSPGQPVRLLGEVNTVRGNYDFQGRRFEILRDGAVRFRGLEEVDPALDIRASRIIQAVEARVNVRGTMRHPEIVLSSVPPLEQADILSLIVFNQPINDLAAGQQASLAERAEAIAAGALAGQLASSIGRALNLDTFQIDVAPTPGRVPEVTIGQQLGQDLYVRVEQGIGADESSTNFVLEYELTEWLRLQANVVQGVSTQPSLFQQTRGSGADLIVFFSF